MAMNVLSRQILREQLKKINELEKELEIEDDELTIESFDIMLDRNDLLLDDIEEALNEVIETRIFRRLEYLEHEKRLKKPVIKSEADNDAAVAAETGV